MPDDSLTPQNFAVSPETQQRVEQIVDTVFNEASPDLSLARVQTELNDLDAQPSEARPALTVILESMGGFFFGLKEIQIQNFSAAKEHFTKAAHGFDQLAQLELRDLAAGLAIYGAALVELQASNIGRGVELFKEVGEYLNKAGKFGQTYRQLIDQIQPENLFIQANQKMAARDFGYAKALVEQASEAAEKVAKLYFEPGSAGHSAFVGFAHYYKAYYTVVRAFADFNLCKYDSLATEIDLQGEAVQAQAYLSKAADENPIARSLSYLSQGHTELLLLIPELASLMQTLLNSSAQPQPEIFSRLRQRIRRANEVFAKAGPAAGVLTRVCDDLFTQLNNIEKLAKPAILPVQQVGPSVREAMAAENFREFQKATLDSLRDPLGQLSRWSILTLILVGASVSLVILGAGSALLGHTQVGLVTSVSSILTSIISGVLLSQLRKAETEVKESRKDLLKLFGDASKRFFTAP